VLELLVATLLYLLRTTGCLRYCKEALVSIQIIFSPATRRSLSFFKKAIDIPANNAATQIYPLLRGQSGPVLSQQGSFALFAGEKFHSALSLHRVVASGDVGSKSIIEGDRRKNLFLRHHRIPNLQSISSGDAQNGYTGDAGALRKNYRLDRAVNPYYLYVPGPVETKLFRLSKTKLRFDSFYSSRPVESESD